MVVLFSFVKLILNNIVRSLTKGLALFCSVGYPPSGGHMGGFWGGLLSTERWLRHNSKAHLCHILVDLEWWDIWFPGICTSLSSSRVIKGIQPRNFRGCQRGTVQKVLGWTPCTSLLHASKHCYPFVSCSPSWESTPVGTSLPLSTGWGSTDGSVCGLSFHRGRCNWLVEEPLSLCSWQVLPSWRSVWVSVILSSPRAEVQLSRSP